MAIDYPLIIGYGGSLAAFEPGMKRKTAPTILSWIWTWRVNNIDESTRSAYFLFKAIEYGIAHGYFAPADIQVKLWGMIAGYNKIQVGEMHLDNIVTIEGYVNRSENHERLLACDVLFLPLESGTPVQPTLFIPGKLFEYIKTGKPIFCLTRGGDCADILVRSGLGVIADPLDIPGTAKVLQELIKNKKQSGIKLNADMDYIKQFEFRHLTGTLAAIFDKILN